MSCIGWDKTVCAEVWKSIAFVSLSFVPNFMKIPAASFPLHKKFKSPNFILHRNTTDCLFRAESHQVHRSHDRDATRLLSQTSLVIDARLRVHSSRAGCSEHLWGCGARHESVCELRVFARNETMRERNVWLFWKIWWRLCVCVFAIAVSLSLCFVCHLQYLFLHYFHDWHFERIPSAFGRISNHAVVTRSPPSSSPFISQKIAVSRCVESHEWSKLYSS